MRTATTLGFTWKNDDFTGGTPIIDYRVSMAELGGSYTVVATSLTTAAYTAVGLTPGKTYEFRVESRNSYSYSTFSSVLQLFCAFKPEPPLVVTTTNSNDLVKLEWSAPETNGGVITLYKIYIHNVAADSYI